MKTKILLVAVTLLGLASAHVSYWCMYTNGFCYGSWIDHLHEPLTQPIYYFALYAWPAILATLFARGQIFKFWLKFAMYYIPIAFLLVALTPVMQAPGTFLDPFPFYRVNAAELAGQVFSVLTILLVAWKYIGVWRSRRQ